MRRFFYGLALLLVACGNAGALEPTRIATQNAAPTVSITPTTVLNTSSTPLATAPAEPDSILIWWPAALYPDPQSEAGKLLQQEVDGYQTAHGKRIIIREKRSDGLGSIYQTLRSGSTVAPAVMPDLALMQRSDLIQAVAGKLIVPMDLALLGIDDLFVGGRGLAEVNGILYGVPYTLEIQHTIYRTSVLSAAPAQLDDVIQSGQLYFFPAGASKGVNSTLLAQYLAANGRVADDKGTPLLDAVPLLDVLRYYEQAVQAKVADATLLDYTSASQYWSMFVSGKASFAQVDSTTYLAQRSNLTGVASAAVPMPGDQPVVAVDSWIWVITTTDPDRQIRANNALAWLMRADQQGKFTQQMNMLPSRQSALLAWGNDDPYVTFASTLLNGPTTPPPDMINPVVGAALQHALEDVLTGRKSAQESADSAVALVYGGN